MSPRSDAENERIREERRRQIILGSARVFARRGLAASKIADLAAASGMSHGLVYHYFPSKEDLFAALVKWASEGALTMTLRAQDQPGTPWDRLRWLVTMMLHGVREQPDVFMVMIQCLTSEAVPEPVREMALRPTEQNVKQVAGLIAECQAAGQVRAGDPLQLAAILLSAVQGLAMCCASGIEAFMQGFPDVETMLATIKA